MINVARMMDVPRTPGEITCLCGKKLGELLQVSGTVAFETKCRDNRCRRVVRITLEPGRSTVEEVNKR